jgi:flagellar FliL protein
MDDIAPETTEPVVETKKGGILKKVVLSLAAVLAVASGATAYWILGGERASANEARVEIAARGVLPFEPFLVNLSDPGGNRFLKVTLNLVVESGEAATEVGGNASLMSHARSAILELLTEQQAQALVTADGKQALKDAIRKRVSGVITQQRVLDVLFSEFVVQF